MVDVPDLAKVVQAAALDTASWESALNSINSFVEGSGVVLLSVGSRLKFAPTSTDINDMMDDYFANGWYLRDRRDKCIPILKQRGVVFDKDFQTIEEIDRSEFYNDLLAKYGRKWFAGVAAEVDGDHWCLALQRSSENDPFSANDMPRLQVLRTALLQAAYISKAIGRTWISGMHYALNAIEKPAIFLDKDGRILEYNEAAAPIVKDLFRGDRWICSSTTRSIAALTKIVSAALQPLEARPDAVNAELRSSEACYFCQAISLLDHKSLIGTSAAVLLMMERVPKATGSAQLASYGLTKTEFRIAMALAGGKSVKEMAHDAKVRDNTIRMHLKSIYQKTNMKRQSQLVALMHTLIPCQC